MSSQDFGRLFKQTIRGQRIKLSRPEDATLGADLTLDECTIVINVPTRALSSFDTKMINCLIEVRRRLVGFSWCETFFKGCSFRGSYSDCSFGFEPKLHGKSGGIERCDFTNATLEGCTFYNCDIGTILFPQWPCFTISEPASRAHEMATNAWPGESHFTFEAYGDAWPEVSAIVGHAPRVAARGKTTVEELREALIRLEGVLM